MPAAGPELLTRLLDEHGASLVLCAQQWCAAPEDVVQEAFIQLMRESAVPTNVVGWLYRVVRNGAISASRSASRRTRHEVRAAQQSEAWFATNHDERLDAAAATEALAALPIEVRETIVLRLWGGLNFEQIAEVMHTSTSTAHRRYVVGLAGLRERQDICTSQTSPRKG
jgi:RNA polymerase sigma factor (sigma-70 family)